MSEISIKNFVVINRPMLLLKGRKSGSKDVFCLFSNILPRHMKSDEGLLESLGRPKLCGSSLDFEFIRECLKINKIHPKYHFLTRIEMLLLGIPLWRPLSCHLVASPQTSFGVRLSRIHFSPTDRREEMNEMRKWMRDKRTPKDVCGEASHLLTSQDIYVHDHVHPSHSAIWKDRQRKGNDISFYGQHMTGLHRF